MTISYNAEVAHCTGFGCCPKLLIRWRARIYKLIWVNLLAYMALYYAINFTYRYLDEEKKKYFEILVKYCHYSITLIPLTFIVGFYVSIVIVRWWGQYMTMPWPDSTAVYVSCLVKGNDESGRKMRRTIMRYCWLSLTMVLTMISPEVKRLFPTLETLVEVGLLEDNEMKILRSMELSKHGKHWTPIVWAASVCLRARKEGRIRDDFSLKTIIDSLNSFREICMTLTFYDTRSIRLVYTEVVTFAVYSYFLASVFGDQWTGITNDTADDTQTGIDYFFPFFTILEFFFFMGWLKLAESLICPFGDDDDDLELNWKIDRNTQVSYLIVDDMHNEHPDLVRGQYWDEVFPRFVPWRSPSSDAKPPKHSTAKFDGEETEAAETKQKKSIIPLLTDALTPLFVRSSTASRFSNSSSSISNVDSEMRRLIEISQTEPAVTKEQSKHEIFDIPSDDVPNDETIVPNESVRKTSSSSSLDSATYRKRSSKTGRITSYISYEKPKLSTTDTEVDDFERLRRERQDQREIRQESLFERAKELSEVISCTRISNDSQTEIQRDTETTQSDNENEENENEYLEKNKKE